MARPWIGGGDGRHRDVLCADPAVPTPEPNPTTASHPRSSSTPEPNPTKAATPTRTPTPPTALVPVVSFWSATAGISRGQLDAALVEKGSPYRRVVAGTLPGATVEPRRDPRGGQRRRRTLGLPKPAR